MKATRLRTSVIIGISLLAAFIQDSFAQRRPGAGATVLPPPPPQKESAVSPG